MLEAKSLVTITACENLAVELDPEELSQLFNIWKATKWLLVPKTIGYVFEYNHYHDPDLYKATNRSSYDLGHLIATRFNTVSQDLQTLMVHIPKNIYRDLHLLVNLIRCARLKKLAETAAVTDTAKNIEHNFRDIVEDTVIFDHFDMKFIKTYYPTLATAMPKLLLAAAAEALTNVAKIYDEKSKHKRRVIIFLVSLLLFSVPFINSILRARLLN